MKLGKKGYKYLSGTTPTTYSFYGVQVITTAVIDEITHPANVGEGYAGDEAIEGVSIPAGTILYIKGDAITMTSGTVVLYKR